MLIHETHNKVFDHFLETSMLFRDVKHFMHALHINNHRTAYIIGNSPTINELTDADWQDINDGYSIAFSSFAMFDKFTPRLLITECSEFYNTELGEKTLDAMVKLSKKFIPIILKDTHFKNDAICNKIINKMKEMDCNYKVFVETCRLSGNNKKQIESVYKNIFLTCGNTPDFLVSKRGSITMALFMLLVAGFKRINFIACELENSNYFYSDVKNDTIHLTSDVKYGLPIEDVIFTMIKAYNEINVDNKAVVKAHRGRLLSDSIISKFDF